MAHKRCFFPKKDCYCAAICTEVDYACCAAVSGGYHTRHFIVLGYRKAGKMVAAMLQSVLDLFRSQPTYVIIAIAVLGFSAVIISHVVESINEKGKMWRSETFKMPLSVSLSNSICQVYLPGHGGHSTILLDCM